MSGRLDLRRELSRWFTFPAGHPTDADLDQIVDRVADFRDGGATPPSQWDIERIVTTQVPQARVHRYDGLDFRMLNALLALLRAQAQEKKA